MRSAIFISALIIAKPLLSWQGIETDKSFAIVMVILWIVFFIMDIMEFYKDK